MTAADSGESRLSVPRGFSVWVFLGGLVVTVAGAAAYWFFAFLWAVIQNPHAGPTAIGPFLLMWVPLTVVSFVTAFIAQILSYPLLVASTSFMIYRTGRVPLSLLVAISPLLALLAWFAYEHFVPEYRWYTDETPPYEYGLSFKRFLSAWAFQIVIVLGYWWPLRTSHLAVRTAT